MAVIIFPGHHEVRIRQDVTKDLKKNQMQVYGFIKMRSVFKPALRCIFLALTVRVHAVTYYVSPSGSDITGDGSSARPWRSIGKAAQAPLQPGDLVLIEPGNYPSNNVTFRRSGAAAIPLTTGVSIVPPNRLVFPSGTDLSEINLTANPNQYYLYVYRSWHANSGVFLVTNAVNGTNPYVEVSDAEWRAETGAPGNEARLSACVARPIVFRNSSSNRAMERIVVDASGSSIYTLFYVGDYKSPTTTEPADFILIDGFDLTGMQGGGVHLQNSSFNVLRDLRIWNGGAPGILMAGQASHPARYNIIVGCKIWNTPYEGIYLGAGGQPQTNNHLYYAHVLNCEIFTEGTSTAAALENAIDLKEYNVGHTVVGNLIRDIEIVSSYNGAIFLQHDTRDALVYNNRLCNITYKSARPVAAFTLNVQNVTNAHIFNNVIYRTNGLSDQTYAFHIKGNAQAANIHITHNTVSRMHRGLYLEYYDSGAYDITVANNVFGVGDSASNLVHLGGDTERGTLSHNMWSTAPTLYVSETGRLTGDPRFADAHAGDLRLLPDSPAVDSAGYAAPWVAIDHGSHPRPFDGDFDGNAVNDRGAYEFGAAPSDDNEPPSTPNGLRLLGRSPTVAIIGWGAATDNVGVAAYRIERDGLPAGVTDGLEFENEGLASGVEYTYRVRAVDSAGNISGFSSPLTIRTQDAPDGYVIRFDFGHPDYPTTGHWNQVAKSDPNDLVGVLVSNAIDTAGLARGVSLAVVNDFYGVTTGGVNAEGAYPATAIRDGWWVGYHAGYGEPDTVATIRLGGLTPGRLVNLNFLGSRADSTYDRRTVYVRGTDSVQLNAAYNSTNTATLANQAADADGGIEFSVAPLLSSGFGYLNVLEAVIQSSGAHAVTLQGTPYAWLETHYPGSSRYFEALDLEDSDGDGFAGWQEYIADTDPTDAASALTIRAIHMTPSPTVSFESSTARLYALMSVSDLASGAWSNAAGINPRFGQGPGDAFTVTNTPTSAAFYRLKVWPP